MTAIVLNPARIVPCQYGEELSAARVRRVPKPQNTDNWHIRHLPPKCLAHAEKFTQSAGGPSSALLGGENRRSVDMELFPFVHEIPQLKAPRSDCEIPQAPTGSYLNPTDGDRKPPLSLTEGFLYNPRVQKVVCALPTLCPPPRWTT